MSVRQEMLKKLMDVFNKNPNSNIGKLLLILSEKTDEMTQLFLKIENWRDIDQAEGKTLDALGQNHGQFRGKVTDEIMRFLIRARIARNSSDGTIDKMIEALSRSLNTEPSTIKYKALYSEGQPAALMIEGVPVTALNKAGMTAQQFGYIAQEVAAGGIRIASIDLSGTFAFATADVLEIDLETGFAPIDQSSGGTLGGTYDPNENIELPF